MALRKLAFVEPPDTTSPYLVRGFEIEDTTGEIYLNGQVLGNIQSTTVTLSVAQLLALITDPPTIIPAPGVGKMILIVSALAQLKFATTPYTVADPATFQLSLSTVIGDDPLVAWSVDSTRHLFTRSQSQIAPANDFSSNCDDQSAYENSAVWLHDLGAISNTELTDGDSPLTVTANYTVVTLS